ncbi:hypothetical protein [Albibacillus kandeliae]|uniref:hypothetical protein n=1 Tax=Albibacillus kandeliae TaxID=2174228 RepID=UPI000D68D3B0|nr:hypothetical protein [Albibacillus kandeliae]
MDLLFANTIMLPVTTWLGWTAATSVPLMEGYLPPVEGTAWPVAVAVVSVAFLATGVSDLIRSSHVSAVPSALMAVLVGALALRLLFLPFLAPPPPRMMSGTVELLLGFTALYTIHTLFLWRRSRRRAR